MGRGRKVVKMIEVEECTLLSAAIEFYEHNKAKGLAMSTQEGYKTYVNEFINWLGKEMLISDITPKLLEKYIGYKDSKGNKPVSISTTMVHIRRFLRFCSNRGYIEPIEVTIPKYEVELKEPYTQEELQKLLKKPISKNWVELRNWCMVNYFYGTGQRLSSVLNIKVKDIDLDLARVKLTWNKDKIQKYMPLPKSLVEIIREYIYLSNLKDDEYLFPEYEGGQLKKRSAESSIAEYNKKRGVNKTSIHLFRHAFSKNYIMAGGSPVKLQKLLNHKTIDMSMKYVNIYGNDILNDVDIFNPLDTFNSKNKAQIKRRKVDELRRY